jgi:hypothetical protein
MKPVISCQERNLKPSSVYCIYRLPYKNAKKQTLSDGLALIEKMISHGFLKLRYLHFYYSDHRIGLFPCILEISVTMVLRRPGQRIGALGGRPQNHVRRCQRPRRPPCPMPAPRGPMPAPPGPICPPQGPMPRPLARGSSVRVTPRSAARSFMRS